MKVFKPTDFKRPVPDVAIRIEIANKLQAELEGGNPKVDFGAGDALSVSALIEGTYDHSIMLDFQTWYCKEGGWKEVVSLRTPGKNQIKITLLK